MRRLITRVTAPAEILLQRTIVLTQTPEVLIHSPARLSRDPHVAFEPAGYSVENLRRLTVPPTVPSASALPARVVKVCTPYV
jgi:hypothetical protein